MAQPEFDWTFEDVPLEGEARPAGGGPGPLRPGSGPRQRRPADRLRTLRAWPRWAWWALLGGVAALLLGGYGFVQLGWLRLQRQIAAEVAYDDARSRTREVDAVLGAQAGNDAYWRAQRTAEVTLGLPAPLPAGNLFPTSDPAQVVSVRSLGGSLFTALVRRRYADAAGQAYAFDLEQRYFNVAPGEWVRLGTELNGLVAATIVQGTWFSATVPTNDLPWVRPALVAANDALLAACDAWQTCPPGYQLPLAFNAGPDLLNPSRPLRATDPLAGPYPLIFDLSASAPGYPERIVFSAPQLTGRPADAAAQAAYNRALSAQLLGYMAAAISQSARSSSDFMLDALVARMETRLGLSEPADPAANLDPLNFVPAGDVWNQFQQALATGGRAGLADRQRALALMNLILADQPPSVDGDLLRTVHRPYVARLEDWLAGILGPGDVGRAAERWEAANQLAIATPGDWSDAEGLALICEEGVSLVEGGVLQRVGPPFDSEAYAGATLHRPVVGPYLAMTDFRPLSTNSWEPEVRVFGPDVDAPLLLISPGSYGVGWGADGAFYYLELIGNDAYDDQVLLRYDPASGQTTEMAPGIAAAPVGWTPDRRALLIIQSDAGAGVGTLRLLPLEPEPEQVVMYALVQYNQSLETLSGLSFSPDSTPEAFQLAYVLSRLSGVPAYKLRVLDQASGVDQVFFDSTEAGLTDVAGNGGVLWSPGGIWLAWSNWLAVSRGFGSSGAQLFTATASGGSVREWKSATGTGYFPLGFSIDDRYLAVRDQFTYDPATYALLDLTATTDTPALTLTGRGFAWAPTGHTFAFSNALGVFLVDAATGAYQWLQAAPCDLDWAL